MAKRVQGYMVDIRLFVPVNPKDLNDPVEKSQAVQAAIAGDLTRLDGARLVKIEHNYTSTDGDKIAALFPARLDTPRAIGEGGDADPTDGVLVNAHGDELDEEGAPIPRTPEHGEEETPRRRNKAA